MEAPEEIFGKSASGWTSCACVLQEGTSVSAPTRKVVDPNDAEGLHARCKLPIVGSAACDVLRGRGMEADYVGFVVPPEFGKVVGEGDFTSRYHGGYCDLYAEK
ncbi:MAG: hypothetical protein ACLTXL_00605 [Clostridia bacterium]